MILICSPAPPLFHALPAEMSGSTRNHSEEWIPTARVFHTRANILWFLLRHLLARPCHISHRINISKINETCQKRIMSDTQIYISRSSSLGNICMCVLRSVLKQPSITFGRNVSFSSFFCLHFDWLPSSFNVLPLPLRRLGRCGDGRGGGNVIFVLGSYDRCYGDAALK